MKFRLLLLLSLFGVASVFSQDKKLALANEKYDNFAYVDAIEIYKQVLENGDKSGEIYKKLGNCYFFNSNFPEANKYYEQLFLLGLNDIESEYYFRYSQTLKSVKDYNKSDRMMEKFHQLEKDDYRGKLFMNNKQYLKSLSSDSDEYTIEDAGVNSALSDFGSYFRGNIMYFTSSRKSGIKKNIDKWTNQNFNTLMAATFDGGDFVNIENSSNSLNNKFHESSIVFSKDGKTVYFTSSSNDNGKVVYNKDNAVTLNIYKATLVNNKLTDITQLPFIDVNYNFAHPFLSSDEKQLFFSSDMPGGFGESDIYKVDIYDDGTFGTPTNLGPKINTKAKETFPYVSEDNSLYFASDGHPGLGGLDIFKTNLNEKDYNIKNLGTPINSEKDDFAFTGSPFKDIYFISSNRDGGKGFDDIYKVIKKEVVKIQEIFLLGTVLDESTDKSIPNSKVSLYDDKNNFISQFLTDSKGNFKIDNLKKDAKYTLSFNSKDYTESVIDFTANESNTSKVFYLKPKVVEIKKGDDLLKLLDIVIFFDSNKSFIRSDAAEQLDKIVKIFNDRPELKAEIKSYTDSRGSKEANLKLSNSRAVSTMKYLISKGVNPNRLTAKGFGESNLINNCSDGVPCSDEEHELNRRSEFIITSD